MNLFGASIQVVALVIAAVCLVSAILGRQYGIGPVQIPAPQQLLPRAALAILGLFLLTGAFWQNMFGQQTPLAIVSALTGRGASASADPAFVSRNAAFRKLLETRGVSSNDVRIESEALYGEFATADEHCLIILELADYAPQQVDVYPQRVLIDAVKYRGGSRDTRALSPCDAHLKIIANLVNNVAQKVAGSTPNSDARGSVAAATVTAVSRPTPEVNSGGNISQETAKRVLTAVTLPKDEGWIYIGFRDKTNALLIADRRISVAAIPRAGTVATTADSQLLDTLDPGKTLGTVKGYVRAGSSVQILNISGPRHYTSGAWDGYDVYALVRVVSTPQRVVAVTQLPSASSQSASSDSTVATAADPPTAAAVAAAVSGAATMTAAVAASPSGKCPGLPVRAADLFSYCNETYPVRFGEYQLQAYKETDTHSTGIHFRNIGPLPVSLSIYAYCSSPDTCPVVKNATLPPVSDPHDSGNDYIYNVPTLEPFNFGWTVSTK